MNDSPLPPALRLLSGPLAAAYGRIIAGRNAKFDSGRGVVELDRPVISVGNLSVGGTGKTPMVAWIVRALLRNGNRPVIAMRGYSKSGASDEAMEYQAEFSEVPVVAQPDRLEGLIDLFHDPAGAETDVVVLDDGFQHRKIARQLDVVLIDATRDPFADRLLPRGWLREPVESLGRAGSVVITHAECAAPSEIDRLRREIATRAPGIALSVARHGWSELIVVEGGAERRESTGWLKGKRVVAACGIGNPGPFLKAVREASGAEVLEFVRPDHDPYLPRTIMDLFRLAKDRAAQAIVMTGKDWAKLRAVRPDAWPCPVVRPKLEMMFQSGGEELLGRVLEAAKMGGTSDAADGGAGEQ